MVSAARCLLVAAAALLAADAAGTEQWDTKQDEQGRTVQSLQIQAPTMTEEDQYGYTMPDQYRCDACKVVAHHLGEALKLKQPKNRRLQEWEYQDIYDETCKSGLSGYGVAFVDGENVLSGPALKRDDVKPGMGAIQMGGETWEKRLGEICRKFVYERIGEDELYEHFHAQGEVSSDLCFRETRDCHLGPKAPHELESSKKPAKAKKEKKRKQGKSDDTGAIKASDIDISAFMSKLAKKHGVAKSEYTRKRSFSEWEQLLGAVQAVQRTSEQIAGQNGQVIDI